MSKSSYENLILGKLSEKKASCVGSSSRTLVDLAQDLVNAAGGVRNAKNIAAECFMAKATVERLAEADTKYDNSEIPYQPRAHTIEKILRYSNIRLDAKGEAIAMRFQNKPMEE